MVRVCVVSGGNSPEREVSLRSGKAVQDALEIAGYGVQSFDPAQAPLDDLPACDVVFIAIHGTGGEDGSLQAALEARGIKYTGSGAEASHLCFDKWLYREHLQKHGLLVPKGEQATLNTYANSSLFSAPHVLKPVAGGSSIDTFIISEPTAEVSSEIVAALKHHGTLLAEALVVGHELTVGVLGDTVLPVIEIIPPTGKTFDYTNKYNGATQELCPPEHVDKHVQQAAQNLARQAHALTGCRDLSRTDIIVAGDGKLYILETNTIPGMTEQSLFPKMAAAAGIPMTALVSELVEMALKH